LNPETLINKTGTSKKRFLVSLQADLNNKNMQKPTADRNIMLV